MLLSIDDTDGPKGGCTTHLATHLIQEIGPENLDGFPRLVRLDPSHPYKTRGNAAITIPLHDHLDPEPLLQTAKPLLEEHAHTNPNKGTGLIILHDPPSPRWYHRGLHENIPLNEAKQAIRNTPTLTQGNGRGLIGALCAAAWNPQTHDHTYTHITYREPHRWGTPRRINPNATQQLDQHPHTFDCWDPHDEHPTIAPRTPCPVLYGARSTQPLNEPPTNIAHEPIHHAQTFVTNQATDDHIHPDQIQPAHVTGTPDTLKGGHIRVPTQTRNGDPLDVMAFEPTGPLRKPLRNLREGDTLLPIGDHKEGQINTEKALILTQYNTPNRCPTCNGNTRSKGSNEPRRCPRCGTYTAPTENPPTAVWIEAAPSARRHLARPLSLGIADHIQEAADQATPLLGS